MWQSVDPDVMVWCPSGEDEPSTVMRDPRRVLLFHIAACLDVNECEMEFLNVAKPDRERYMKSLYNAVARESMELENTGVFSIEQLVMAFSMVHCEMRAVLKRNGRRKPSVALLYWKECNSNQSFAILRIFNTIALQF